MRLRTCGSVCDLSKLPCHAPVPVSSLHRSSVHVHLSRAIPDGMRPVHRMLLFDGCWWTAAARSYWMSGSNFRAWLSWFWLRLAVAKLQGKSGQGAEANLMTCRAWTGFGTGLLRCQSAKAEPWRYGVRSILFTLGEKEKKKKRKDILS
jgi:hypothetical protein